MTKLTVCLALFMLTCTLRAQSTISVIGQDTQLVMETLSGKLRGKISEGISIFKGIPFAAPPVGPFRWRPPQPVAAWQGVRDALEFGPDCAQAGWGGARGTITKGSSEDCLYLNVWAAAWPKAKLPVMVWIHGGGFVGGSGARPETFGYEFAKNGVILVTINYRLGRLGFFAHPALDNEYPDEPKGNYGYMDQIAALQWVQRNISAWGGDPNNVTIFGESAGGVSVHSLLTIPAANGLFHKAILESSGGRDGILSGRPLDKDSVSSFYPVSAMRCGLNFASRHKVEGINAEALNQLRMLRVEEIVDGGAETDGEGGARIYAGPILDGKLVTETFQQAYSAGRAPKIPIIIGSNNAEMQGAFVVKAGSKEELLSQFGALKSEAAAAYDPQSKKALTEMLSMVNTDKVWAEPARFTANAFSKKGVPAYLYLFSYVPDSLRKQMPYGASHGSEIAYVFNTLHTRWGLKTISSNDQSVAKLMNTYWANFAKTGNPNGAGLPEWPVFHHKKQSLLEIQSNGKAVGKQAPNKLRLDVIEKEVKLGKLHKNGV